MNERKKQGRENKRKEICAVSLAVRGIWEWIFGIGCCSEFLSFPPHPLDQRSHSGLIPLPMFPLELPGLGFFLGFGEVQNSVWFLWIWALEFHLNSLGAGGGVGQPGTPESLQGWAGFPGNSGIQGQGGQ